MPVARLRSPAARAGRLLAAAAVALALGGGCRQSDQHRARGTCTTAPSSGAVPHRELAISDPAGLGPRALRITSAAELARLRRETGADLEAVDFSREQILLAAVVVEGTCGLRGDDVQWRVVGDADTAHLELALTNPDGTCSAACDMAWTEAVAVAVPRSRAATVCARATETCAR